MDFELSPKARDLQQRVRTFVHEQVIPVETRLYADRAAQRNGDWSRWSVAPEVEALKEQARAAGLWNLFLPEVSGLSVVEYAPLAEEMGKSVIAPEVFNCNAPDTGNMEVLERYGSPAQKERWLKPLLAGQIRSAFCMTEPDVASSDATNMRATARLDGDSIVLDGKKWWSSGIGHPHCKVAIFMGASYSPNTGSMRSTPPA